MAAALKKVVFALLKSKKGRKVLGGIVLGIIIVIFLPLAALLSIFNGEITFDAQRLEEVVIANLSAEDIATLQNVEDTMYAIEEAMTAAGFPKRATEAQVLFVFALSDFAENPNFATILASCFTQEQTDPELISAVNSNFGTELVAEEFSQIMEPIRNVYISTSGYTDPSTKNNLDLVQWAKEAKRSGWGYVWGTYGRVLTDSLLDSKLKQYPDELSDYEDFIRENWLGGRTADCVGLIKGYSWFNPETGAINYATNGMPDIGSDTMYQNAVEKGTIDAIPEVPGLAVWRKGHIGIYIGGGEVIHASGTKAGVIQTSLQGGSWTHWLKIPYITYVDEKEVPQEGDGDDR